MQKLTDLEIEKVAFVPQGDNKGADVVLFKRKPAGSEGTSYKSAAEEGEKKITLKGLVSAFIKALGFSVDDIEKSATEANPKNGAAETTSNGETVPKEVITKGVDENMKIDKSKLTLEELAQLEAIEKKAGIQEDDNPTAGSGDNDGTGSDGNAVNKNTEPDNKPAAGNDDDIYKGLHPAVAAELKSLRKRADEAEDREMTEVAKKYEILGKKPEELAKTLKALKAAGGSAYDDMIGVLDASLATVEKSGAFSEVGKSGSGQPDAWTQIEKHADEIMKAVPTMTRAQAIDKACEQHPELVAEYEQNR